jgi:hypothetical protein
MIMRGFVILLALAGFCGAGPAARAANDCKACRDQQQACVKNHSRSACATEYEICMRHCGKK